MQEIFFPALSGALAGALAVTVWRLRQLSRENVELSTARGQSEQRAVSAEAQNLNLHKQLQDQFQNLEQTKRQLHTEFENQHRRFLEESQERMQRWSKDSFQTLVQPVDQELKLLQKRIHEVYDIESRERLSLKNEIEFMVKAQGQLSLEAQSLTQALRGDSRAQGHWGEIVLERILESSGLREGEEFVVQGRGMGLKSEEGQTRKPDVLVRLPGDRHLIIDSKVSLTNYEQHLRAQNETERQEQLDEFLRSIRRHLDDLSAKNYSQLYGVNSPDFVLLFMPTDGAFSLAHQADPNLFILAMEKRVAIVSPSLLFPNLRTVEAIWRQERQNRNAEEIARQAGGLYDKFAGLLEDLELLSTHLRRADETREALMGKLKEGRGNLLDRVEKLRTLGARTKKRLLAEADAPAETDSSL
ncbi:MAG: DNA recombination protein RmuC [Bdellovibrionales bacterium]